MIILQKRARGVGATMLHTIGDDSDGRQGSSFDSLKRHKGGENTRASSSNIIDTAIAPNLLVILFIHQYS